jgi:hypothetical protein
VQERHEILGGLLVAREDAPVVFDLAEETLNQVALFVDVSVIGRRGSRRLERGGITTSIPWLWANATKSLAS